MPPHHPLQRSSIDLWPKWRGNLVSIISLFLVFFFSCKHRGDHEVSSRLIPIREAKGYVVPQDSLVPPVTIEIDERKLKSYTVSPAKRISTHSNIIPANHSIKIKLEVDRICVPGHDGFARPVQKTILVNLVPAPLPEIVAVKPMHVMDSNPEGFTFFASQKGLEYANILHIIQDHLGNLWLATIGGFIKYDGKYFSNYKLTKDISDWSCSIHEDTSGNIWFGTQKGLVKFDGKTFAYFDDRNGISPDHLYYVEKSGSIWIAPKSGGITKLTPIAGESAGALRFTYMHFGEKEGFTDKIIDKIFEDRVGHRWFLCRDMAGMIELQPQLLIADSVYTFVHFNLPYQLKKNIPEMLESHDGHLWFSGSCGIWKLAADTLSLFAYSEEDTDLVAPLLEDQVGNIWCSVYEKGIIRFQPQPQGNGGNFIRLNVQDGLSDHRIHTIFEDNSGNIWIGSENGLNLYRPKFMTHLTEKQGLADNITRSIMEDRSGNLWLGSGENGVSQMVTQPNNNIGHATSFAYFNKKNGMNGTDVFSIIEDRNDNIWLGTVDGGISRYTPGDNGTGIITNLTKEDGLDGAIYSMLEDFAGNIWFGEFSGYVGLPARLYRYTPAKENHPGELTSFSTAQGLSDNSVDCIVEDNEKNLWLTTWQGGVTRYTPPSADHPAVFTHFTIKEGMSNNEVRTMVKDYRGNLWFGTSGDGLIYYNGKSFVAITEKEGLSNNYLKSSLSDHAGNLWFGTEYGLNKLSKNIVDTITDKVSAGNLRESDIRFHTYTYDDGFVGKACWSNAIAEDRNGIVWVGAEDRVSGIHPEAEVLDTVPPVVELTGIDLFNESLDWSLLAQHRDSTIVLGNGVKVRNAKFESLSSWYSVPEKLKLTHRNNYVTFHFIGITMARPEKVRYQFRLDGQDENWSASTADNFTTYGNLSPGYYTLKVRAMNSEQYWSRELNYPFIIRPPWWQTWWAFLAYGCLLVVAVYMALQIFKRRLLLRHQLKAKDDEAIRLKELDTFKSQLFTNLTHEFRTPLTVILGMSKQLANGAWKSIVGENEKGRISKGLEMIENNGKNLLQLINQLLDLSKLENKSFKLQNIQADIIPYLRYVTDSFQSYADDVGVTLVFSSPLDSIIMDFDPEQLKQILTNLISNALKFTPSGGEINVTVQSSSGKLIIAIKDTGIGIAEKDLPHVMDRFYQADSSSTRVAQGTGIGLAHTQELLKIMGGEILLESELGKGTTVTLQLPIRHLATLTEQNEIGYSSRPHLDIARPKSEFVTDTSSSPDQQPSFNENISQLLIIEDNPDVVDYIRSCLEPEYQINVAFNGKVGVEKALEEIPDLIVSDVMMPEMDGFQVCEVLKNDERTSHIPILLLTAKADAASRLTGLRRGADAYMAKPFSPEELSLQISTLLENRGRIASYFSRTLHTDSISTEMPGAIQEAIQIEDAFVKKVNAIIEAHYTDDDFALPRLCDEIGMSRSQLFRKIKAVADTSPSDMIRTFRLRKAKSLLEQGDVTVAEVTYQVGFKDPSYFTKMFQEEFGVLPKAV